MAFDGAIVNTFFKKKETQLVTFKSGAGQARMTASCAAEDISRKLETARL